MDTAWTFRIVLIMAFAVIIFGDFLGYGNAKKSDHPHTNDLAGDHQHPQGLPEAINADKWTSYLASSSAGGDISREALGIAEDEEDSEEARRIIKSNLLKLTSQEVIDEEEGGFGSKMTFTKSPTGSKSKITETLRDSCLPKMLCEMAARPNQMLSDREKDLLSLIKSTTLTLAMAITPTRWHFAAHMGQLLRYTGDSLTGPTGCSQLWPQCPFSSQKLMRLSAKMSLK